MRLQELISKNESTKLFVQADNQTIPIVEVLDPYAYVTSNKVIAIVTFKGTNGERKERKILRTKNQGYVMQ